MASSVYNIAKLNLMNKVLDLESATIKVALMDNSVAPVVTDVTYSTIAASYKELTTTGGYTVGGATLTTPAVSAVGNTAKFTGDAVSWGATASFTAYFAVLYDSAGIGATNNLICWIDFGGAQTVATGTFTITWNASGIIVLS